LSLEHASLLDTKISRSFSVIIEYDELFEMMNVSFRKSLIKVTKNLSYEEAQTMINMKQNDSLVKLYEFAQHFYKGNGTYDTHEMVAVYMILANTLVACHLSQVNPSGVILRSQPYRDIKIVECENKTLEKKYMNSLQERAMYSMGISGNSSHSSLGLEYYTHFTSPIRRYVDIMVHRELFKSIESMPDLNIIKRINEYSKYYKKLQRHTKLISITETIDEISEFDAYIISLRSENNMIRVYVEQLDLEIDIKVFNNKFSQIMENISENENELSIINTQTVKGITLELYQKISILIVKTQNFFKPITTTIINPNIQEILEIA
jgi:exoribonuclease R